jgi:hypothetical protein
MWERVALKCAELTVRLRRFYGLTSSAISPAIHPCNFSNFRNYLRLAWTAKWHFILALAVENCTHNRDFPQNFLCSIEVRFLHKTTQLPFRFR